MLCFVLILCLCGKFVFSQDEISMETFRNHPHSNNPTTTQRNYHHFETRILPNGKIQPVAPIINPNNMVYPLKADDRHIHWIKHLQKWKKKLKWYKKNLKRCRFPHKFQIVKKSDNDEDHDIIKIQVPLNYEDTYLNALRKTGGNATDTEDMGEADTVDEFDEKYISDNIVASQEQKTTHFPVRPYMMNAHGPISRPVPYWMNPQRIPPFRPLPGHIPMFGPLRVIIRRPWSQPTPWYYARPGTIPMPYRMREPIPGEIPFSPPRPVLKNGIVKKLNKTKTVSDSYWPLKETNSKNQSYNLNVTVNHYKIPQQYDSPVYLAHNNPNSYNTKYSQPDYSLYGSYDNVGQKSSPLNILSTTKIDEIVVTVTPLSAWGGAQPIYVPDGHKNSRRSKTKASHGVEDHIRRLDDSTSNSWVPIKPYRRNDDLSDKQKHKIYVTHPPIENIQPHSPKLKHHATRVHHTKIINPTTEKPPEYNGIIAVSDGRTLKNLNFSSSIEPKIISKENKDQYSPSQLLVYCRTENKPASNKEVKNTAEELLDGIKSNSTRIRYGIQNMSTLVSSSILFQ